MCVCVRACARKVIVSTADQFTTEALIKKTNMSPLIVDEIRFISSRNEKKFKNDKK